MLSSDQNKIISLPQINIIGIEVKTTNQNNKSQKDIAALWQKFYSQNFLSQIPNKLDNQIVCLYTNYEGDFTKPYSVIIGCKVKKLTAISNKLVAKTIPAAKYIVFEAKGELPNAIIKAWEKIWSSDITRSYTNDFEIYFNGNNSASAKIYVGVKD